MAKTTLTLAVLLFFFSVNAQARFSLNRAVDEDPLTVLPESEPEPEAGLLLPSESTAVVAWEPETGTAGEDSGEVLKSVTAVSVRVPAKRGGAHHKVPFSFRFGLNKKRRHQVRSEGKRVTGYRHGKGSAEGRQRAGTVFGDRPRQFPGRLMRLRNPGHKRGEEHMKKKSQRNSHVSRHVRRDEKRHHHQKHVHEHVRHVQDHVHEHKHKRANNGLVRKIRKFLMSF